MGVSCRPLLDWRGHTLCSRPICFDVLPVALLRALAYGATKDIRPTMEKDKPKVKKAKTTAPKEDKPVDVDNNAKTAQVPFGVYKPLPNFRGCRNC